MPLRILSKWAFFVLEPEVLDCIEGDNTSFEKEVLEKLADMGELAAYVHDDFWQRMDTLRDANMLNDLWHSESAPWIIWL